MSTTRKNKDMLFPAPSHVHIKKNVLSRKLVGIQNYHRSERQNRMDRRNSKRNLDNYNAVVSVGWDPSRIFTDIPKPRMYRRVSPLKLGKRLGTRFGGKLN